jgi:ubiquinone/menaquinone biosynthesis C-methylase UbiE
MAEKLRVPKTSIGIRGKDMVGYYDAMQKDLRDKGRIPVEEIIKSGISSGHALEVGPGPGYIGLEWLSKTSGTQLTGFDISPDMTVIAKRNASQYERIVGRAYYAFGAYSKMLLNNENFDAVFTIGSFHEWSEPESVLDEIYRVLKKGGKFYIADFRRDISFLSKMFLEMNCSPREMLDWLKASIGAAYTQEELQSIINRTKISLCIYTVGTNSTGLVLTGTKR